MLSVGNERLKSHQRTGSPIYKILKINFQIGAIFMNKPHIYNLNYCIIALQVSKVHYVVQQLQYLSNYSEFNPPVLQPLREPEITVVEMLIYFYMRCNEVVKDSIHERYLFQGNCFNKCAL